MRMGATDDLSRENVGVDVGEVHPVAGIPVNNNMFEAIYEMNDSNLRFTVFFLVSGDRLIQ